MDKFICYCNLIYLYIKLINTYAKTNVIICALSNIVELVCENPETFYVMYSYIRIKLHAYIK